MSDSASSLPVRTESNGDVVARLSDGTITSQLLTIDSAGRLTVKLQDGAGTALTSQTNGSQRALDVGVNVAGVQVDPRAIRALTSADVISVVQSTSPWVTKDQSDGPVAPGVVAGFSSLVGGQYNASLPVLTTGQQSAIQIDASGRLIVATVSGDDHNYGVVGAGTLRSAAQIGNATGAADFNFGTAGAQTLRTASLVGNATGAADFNAGATSAQTLRAVVNQGVAATAANGWTVKPTDGTNNQAYLATGEAKVSVTQSLPAGTANVGKVSIQDSAGAAFSATNPLYVTLSDTVGTAVDNYNTAAAVAAGATSTHTYTVTAAKTFYSKQILASASGKLKVEVGYETGVGTGVFTTIFVGFNSTAEPNILIPIPSGKTQIAGAKIQIIRTNKDLLAQDLYTTISGAELP